MISGYKNLTGKYLKASRKRTLLTIIGIVLSVALISTIGLFFNGIQIAQVEEAKNNYGSFHLMFTKVDDNLSFKIINNPKVSRYGFFSIGEEVSLEEKIVVTELFATDKALELLPYRAKEGKLPEKEKEVAIEEWALTYIDKKAEVGEKIRFNNKEYNLVGILENSIQNQMDSRAMILSKDNNINKNNAALAVEISSETNLGKAVNELKVLGEKDTVMENKYLLMMQGVGDSSNMAGFLITLSIIIGIVVISTIAVIYNSFQISVVERIKQFGLLRAVGATPKQVRKLVLREATVLALIGVPIGLLLGVLAIYAITFVFKLIGGDSIFSMEPQISPTIMGISAVVGTVSIYFSALIPAIFAGKTSPLVAISSRASITKEKIKKRKHRIAQMIFGFEGVLASKNIKRSRKRYRITVFSIVISVVLFVTFKSFMDMSLGITKTPNESQNVHFSVTRDTKATQENLKIEDKIIENLRNLSNVDKIYRVYNTYYFNAFMNKDKQIKEVDAIGGIYVNNNPALKENMLVRSSIGVYDKEALEVSKKYLISGSIDIDKLNEENGVVLIKKSRVYNGKTKRTYYGPIADIKVGDEIELEYNATLEKGEVAEPKKVENKKVKVMAILEDDPFNFRGAQDGLKLITTEKVVEILTERIDIKPVNLNITIKNIEDEKIANTEIEKAIEENPSLNIINNIDNNRRDKTSTLLVKILMYGFVIVVSLIGSVNIINTLTTNIILRKRELAGLKSIGLTQRGLRKMIILEGLLYGIIGSIYGSILGCGLSFLMYQGLGGIREFPWSIPWSSMTIAAIACLIIGYLSVLSPLSRIKKENLIEAIREDY